MTMLYVIYDGKEKVGTAKYEHDALAWVSHIPNGKVTASTTVVYERGRKEQRKLRAISKTGPLLEYNVGIGNVILASFMERKHAVAFQRLLNE